MEKSNEIIRIENATKSYPGDFVVLENINLVINRGEFVSIVGQTGAGKSTLLKLIYAEEDPTSGEIYFNGRSVSEITAGILARFFRISNCFPKKRLLKMSPMPLKSMESQRKK
jgi:cell division transport system ATP-binding protein